MTYNPNTPIPVEELSQRPPLTGERLQAIRDALAIDEQAMARFQFFSEDAQTGPSDVRDLLNEVDRLLPRLAAMRAMLATVASMRVEDEIFDQGLFALMSDTHERDGAWHERLIAQARALLVGELLEGGE